MAYSLAISTSMFVLDDPKNEISFKFSSLFRPVIPNNDEALHFLENDDQAQVFFTSSQGEEEKNSTLEPRDELDYFNREKTHN